MMVSETEEWLSFYEQLLSKNGFAPLYAVNFLIIELVIPSWAISVFLVCHVVVLYCREKITNAKAKAYRYTTMLCIRESRLNESE